MKQQTSLPEERLLQDSTDAPVVIATTKEDILDAQIGTIIDAPIELWEALGMDLPDDPATYLCPED